MVSPGISGRSPLGAAPALAAPGSTDGDSSDHLPVAIFLHGVNADHRMVLDELRADRVLEQYVARGGTPFAIAAVDGGGTWLYDAGRSDYFDSSTDFAASDIFGLRGSTSSRQSGDNRITPLVNSKLIPTLHHQACKASWPWDPKPLVKRTFNR